MKAVKYCETALLLTKKAKICYNRYEKYKHIMNEKVEQLRTLVSALENGEPVADQLQALGSERLQQLRTELEEQIQQSKETGGAVLPEKLATMEGLRGLMTDLIHGTLQSYFMDTLLDTHEERLRTVQAGDPETTATQPKRRKATISAFDTPPKRTPEKKTAPKQNAFQRFLAGASTFFGGIWGSIKGFFSSWFPKKETSRRAPEPSTTTPPAETRTPTEIYNADPEEIAPIPTESPALPTPSSPVPSGGEEEAPTPTFEPEASGGAPTENQNLLTSSVEFEGHTIELSHDFVGTFLIIDDIPYSARISGGALRALAKTISLSPEGTLTIGIGKSSYTINRDELRRILDATVSSTNSSIPLSIAYKNASGADETLDITLNRKS